MKRYAGTIAMAAVILTMPLAQAADNLVPQMQAQYQSEGAGDFSAERGQQFWRQKHQAEKEPFTRSCESCHGTDLRQPGEHQRTGKVIEAMAPSVNAERFTDAKKIKKWFRRNCKWTIGRECTPQEKGDVLAWLNTL